jgi:hypothetical protein
MKSTSPPRKIMRPSENGLMPTVAGGRPPISTAEDLHSSDDDYNQDYNKVTSKSQ